MKSSLRSSLLLIVCSLCLGSASSALSARVQLGDLANGAEINNMQMTAIAPASLYTPPTGTTLYQSRGTECAEISGASNAWIDLFPAGDLVFNTGEASSAVEVNFSSQASIGSGTMLNQIEFRCLVSQDDWSSWSSCSGIPDQTPPSSSNTYGIVLARRIKDVNGTTTNYQVATNPGVYIGYALVDPGKSTKLRLQVRHSLVDTGTKKSYVCFPNVILRY